MLVKLPLWQRAEIHKILGPFSLEVENEQGNYKFENYTLIDTLKRMKTTIFIFFDYRTRTAGFILKQHMMLSLET